MSGVTLSLGEAEALVTKAARGAGMPWGLAQEAGRAARRAFAAGAPDADQAFAAWLEAGPGGPDCPLCAGLLAAEMSTEAARPEVADTLVFNAAADRLNASGARRIAIADGPMAVFDRLAHKTYAPATEESRAKGAG